MLYSVSVACVMKLQLYHCPHEGCDYKCPSKNGMNSHFLKHAEPDAFACEVCGKTFKRQAYVIHSVLDVIFITFTLMMLQSRKMFDIVLFSDH